MAATALIGRSEVYYWRLTLWTTHKLNSGTASERVDAVRRLAKKGGEAALRALGEALRQWDYDDVRLNAAVALANLSLTSAMQPLLDAVLVETNPVVCQAETEALYRLGYFQSESPLLAVLVKTEQFASGDMKALIQKLRIKQELLQQETQSRRRDEDATRTLRDLVDRCLIGDALARTELARLQLPESVELLIEAFQRQRDGHFIKAALKQIGNLSVEPLLRALHQTKHYHQRRDIVEALGELADKRSLEPVLEILMDPHSTLRESAARAAIRIDPRAAEEYLIVSIDDVKGPASTCIELLGEMRSLAAIQPLIRIVQNGILVSRPLIRVSLEALVNIGSDLPVSVLTEKLERSSDEWATVRYMSMRDVEVVSLAVQSLRKLLVANLQTISLADLHSLAELRDITCRYDESISTPGGDPDQPEDRGYTVSKTYMVTCKSVREIAQTERRRRAGNSDSSLNHTQTDVRQERL